MRRIERYRGGSTWAELGVYVGILGAAVLGLEAGCSAVTQASYSPEDAQTYVENSGYTDVTLLDTDRFFLQVTGCGRDDMLKYEFEAIAPTTGREVQVDVCKGIFKGATIREG